MACCSIELDEAPLVQTAANLFKQMCYRYREELMAGIIVAGWDKRRGGQVGAKLWSITSVPSTLGWKYKRSDPSIPPLPPGVHSPHGRDAGEAASVGWRVWKLLHIRLHGL